MRVLRGTRGDSEADRSVARVGTWAHSNMRHRAGSLQLTSLGSFNASGICCVTAWVWGRQEAVAKEDIHISGRDVLNVRRENTIARKGDGEILQLIRFDVSGDQRRSAVIVATQRGSGHGLDISPEVELGHPHGHRRDLVGIFGRLDRIVDNDVPLNVASAPVVQLAESQVQAALVRAKAVGRGCACIVDGACNSTRAVS